MGTRAGELIQSPARVARGYRLSHHGCAGVPARPVRPSRPGSASASACTHGHRDTESDERSGRDHQRQCLAAGAGEVSASATAGAGSFTRSFDRMAEVTGRAADQIIAAHRVAA